MRYFLTRRSAVHKGNSLCFAHMQKSGGSSAHDFIIKSFRADRTFRQRQYRRIWAADDVPKHLEAIRTGAVRFVYGHFDPTPVFDVFEGSFFTIVRSPIERVISLYNFCATMDDSALSGITGVRASDFAEGTPTNYAMATDMISMIDTVRAGLSFADFIRLPEQLFLGLESWLDFLAYLPKSGDPNAYAARFDVIGVAEDMSWTLSALARHMGWEPPAETPHVNRTPIAAVTRANVSPDDLAIIDNRTRFEAALYEIAKRRRTQS